MAAPGCGPDPCDDRNPCTDDACNTQTGQCVFIPNDDNVCSDGNECTFDVCLSGVCVSTPSVNCDDGNPCTDDSCNGRTGRCVHTNNDANPCSDGDVCTTDSCSAGRCVGTVAIFCNDFNPCTDDTCDPATGACVYTPNDARTCPSDGTSCTTPGCFAGGCVCKVPLTLWTSASYPNGLDFGMNMGLSWGDYDADGRIDVFNAFSGTLWRNVGGTSWQFASDLSTLVPPTERRYGSSFGDYDNDGLPDIAMSPRVPAWGDDRFHLFHNLGGGPNFTDIAGTPALVDNQPYGNGETLCWADVDGDGNLDLFVPVYPGSLGPGNFFLYNLGPTGPGGAYHFAEVSGAVGLDVPADTARPEGAQFADVDGDGDVDLYANDTVYQNLSTPHAPNFRALSEAASGVGLRGSLDEGAVFFDYDLDGDPDLFVAYVDEGVRIWENRGDGTFFAAEPSIVDSPMTGLGLGMSAEDWDNDGDVDFTTRDVFRRNMLVEDGTRHFTVEPHSIPAAHITSAVPAWGDWDGDGDLDCALGNWGDDGHFYQNRLYTEATPLADRRYIRVRVVRDSPSAPRGLEVEYGAVAEIRLLNVADRFRRRKFVASSHGYLNQNEYTLQFGLPPRPAGGGDLRFDLSVDFPGPPSEGLTRIDRHVNPALGNIDLASLTNREITVDRSGRVVVNGVSYDPVADTGTTLQTTGGGLAVPGAGPLPDPTPAPDPSYWVGLAFDTLGSATPIAVREIILDGQLAAPVDCGGGANNIALWDVTYGSPYIFAVGKMVESTSDRNRRSFFPTDLVLSPGHVYRLVAHMSEYRTSPIAAPVSKDGLNVRGGVGFLWSTCALREMTAAHVDPTAVPLAVRFTPLASGSCLGLPASFCDDGNPCTDDTCGPTGSCTHMNNAGACDDGNPCTVSDRCAGGSCSGSPRDCSDGNPCTDDGCDPASGCTYTNNDAPCDDHSRCTTVDACSGGVCVGGSPLVCNDGNPCTDDSCNPATGCIFTPDDTNTCSDSNVCTTGDVCRAGVCVGTLITCDDGNTCTTDSCLPSFGCTFTAFEVTGVRFTGKTTISWNSRSPSAKYDLAAGDGALFPVLGSGVSESCTANDIGATSATVAPTPSIGGLFWYLVRAQSSSCGLGTYGFAYRKPGPAAERSLTVCP